jgi:hypothetical protein
MGGTYWCHIRWKSKVTGSEQDRFWLTDCSAWHDIHRRQRKTSAVFLIPICIQRNSILIHDLLVVSLPVFKYVERFVQDDLRRLITQYSLKPHYLALKSAYCTVHSRVW